MTRYPAATWRGDGVSGGSFIDVPWRIVVHTTESRHIPGYNNGQSAPHLTYSPQTRKWYQHTSLKYAARALRNQPGGVETNRARAIQVEIVCYSSKPTADRLTPKGLWVGDLPDTAYEDLQRFVGWCEENFRIRPVWPGKQALSSSQANKPGFRMSHSEWNRFDGVCGHQHVPENTHWDPGALDWNRLLPTNPQPSPDPEEPDMPKLPLFSWSRPSYEWAIQNRIYTLTSNLDAIRETEEAQRQMVFLHRYHQNMRGGLPMQLTAEQINAIQDGAVMKVGKKLVG